jgi:hypothetical protein
MGVPGPAATPKRAIRPGSRSFRCARKSGSAVTVQRGEAARADCADPAFTAADGPAGNNGHRVSNTPAFRRTDPVLCRFQVDCRRPSGAGLPRAGRTGAVGARCLPGSCMPRPWWRFVKRVALMSTGRSWCCPVAGMLLRRSRRCGCTRTAGRSSAETGMVARRKGRS